MSVARQIELRRTLFRNRAENLLNRRWREFEAELVTKHLSGPTSGSSVGRRAGALARSTRKIGPTVAFPRVRIGFKFGVGAEAYAAAHVYGAKIRPKRGDWLAIPLVRHEGKVPGFWVRSKRGNPVLIGFASRRPVVVLVKRVVLPKRIPLLRVWRKYVRLMRKDLSKLVGQVWDPKRRVF